MLAKLLGAGEDSAGALGADMNADVKALLHVREV